MMYKRMADNRQDKTYFCAWSDTENCAGGWVEGLKRTVAEGEVERFKHSFGHEFHQKIHCRIEIAYCYVVS